MKKRANWRDWKFGSTSNIKVDGENALEHSQFIRATVKKWQQEIEYFDELSFQLFSKYVPQEQ